MLQAEIAGADNCGPSRQLCTLTGGFFCGGDRIAGCLHDSCCDDAGCCLTYDSFGVASAQCCPSGEDFYGVCNQGQCIFKCRNPCGHKCCLATEVCIPAADPNTDGTCCPFGSDQLCGVGTSSPTCCGAPNVCTAASGICCPPDPVCGDDCCPAGNCCNGQCCNAGSVCHDDRVCCPQSEVACGDTCCATNERCLKRKHPVCKCKKKGRKCGHVHCCAGDACFNGTCLPPLP